ncbi:ATP-binding protein [Nocardiopsis metallicus]|uniref:Uncharacterized protein YPO0396 n=1 Tax=Nocardiopsis metallicus TaxID=179819 RepID=A0A840WC04_9ACTN|nr:ATP-binding protein [Nocardiopsis metallicus]MBB5493674.1 uncharacterized protein YPO0396 [Nocardiopsis metallicus]
MPDSHHAADTAAAQFRLTRLQVINWGTFGGYKDFPIDPRGVLFTGPSGSGKSSLMDAHSIVLLPTRDHRFNASADLTARGAKQGTRNAADYVRGAWSETDDERGQSRIRYLRGGQPTWSAVGATYEDGQGSVTTAVAVKWFTGTETDGASLKSMFRLHDGHFDLLALNEWAERGFDTAWLKKRHPADDPNGQEVYLRRLSKRIGLGTSRTALSLLGKAKAMKNVGDLNLFIRENMLDEPATYEAAEKMVKAFTPLNEAYETAKRADQQKQVLSSVPEDWRVYGQAKEEAALVSRLLGSPLDRYLRRVHVDTLRTEITRLEEVREGLKAELTEQTRRASTAESDYRSLERQLDREGAVLQELTVELETVRNEQNLKKNAFDRYAAQVRLLGLALPSDEVAFTTVRDKADVMREHAEQEREELTPTLHEAFGTASTTNRQYEDKLKELTALRTAGSLIPPRELHRRDQIARGSGVPAADLPYAAELIDLLPEEERWRPAAEKVLRGYGLRLLVPSEQQDAVKAFIDQHDMRGVVDYSVITQASQHQPLPYADTLASKLKVRTDHPYGLWLSGQLARKFDHVCVESTRDLEAHRKAVTVRGTVKLPGNHYRKDDRPDVAKPSSYILGADIATKRAALEEETARLETAKKKARDRADEIARRGDAIRDLVQAAEQVLNHHRWADLDHGASQKRAASLAERIADIKRNDVDLQRLTHQKDAARSTWKRLNDTCSRISNKIEDDDRSRSDMTQVRERLCAEPRTVDDDDHAYLTSLLTDLGTPVRLDTMSQLYELARKELEHRGKSAEAEQKRSSSGVQQAIRRFLDRWEDSAPHNSDDVERSGSDFAALHEEINERRLPEAMDRFRHMISQDMVPSIAFVQRAIEEATSGIKERVEKVNIGLRRTEFNTGTHLQIAHTAKQFAEAKDFRRRVDELMRSQPAAETDVQVSVEQFKRVRRLMARFTSDDAESRRWRDTVLDVRLGYTFYGREETPDGITVSTHRNTATNSGGEQEKLVAFCLAAALSYNLADPSSKGRPRFAPLMLDEAFSKSDETFSGQALAAFEEFGFQLLVAAPIRISGVLEPFIGQVLLVEKRTTAEGARSNATSATFGDLAIRRAAESDGGEDA